VLHIEVLDGVEGEGLLGKTGHVLSIRVELVIRVFLFVAHMAREGEHVVCMICY